jgi:hypothetical protein
VIVRCVLWVWRWQSLWEKELFFSDIYELKYRSCIEIKKIGFRINMSINIKYSINYKNKIDTVITYENKSKTKKHMKINISLCSNYNK